MGTSGRSDEDEGHPTYEEVEEITQTRMFAAIAVLNDTQDKVLDRAKKLMCGLMEKAR